MINRIYLEAQATNNNAAPLEAYLGFHSQFKNNDDQQVWISYKKYQAVKNSINEYVERVRGHEEIKRAEEEEAVG